MNVIYVCKISGFQAAGNQIDIPKKVGTDFFNVPLDNIEKSKNTGINICHISDVRSFEIIEIQPATNLRWSTKLNKFLSDKGELLSEGDLLIFEKLGRSYCVRTISHGDKKYDALLEFFDEEEKHLLLSSSIEIQPKEKRFSSYSQSNLPLQQITYGAPGTGKSHGTEDKIKEIYPNKDVRKLNVFRTTFHPDSDYSTFVGCYKPVMGEPKPIYGFDSVGKTTTVKDNGGNEVYRQELTYKFVPQAFTKAFIRAYELLEENKPVFLVIEEINRGNCAQIFGDLFQLLDREDDGYSKYAIKPDTDLEKHLIDELGDKYDVGEGMKLPKNLHIWATMNTSDQSLFPIDSAFKRRWEWKYVPISRKNANYQIEAEKDGKLMRYDWWEFLDKVNTAIGNATSSEDKKLGYFFCKADKKVNETDKEPRLITADRFVGKVIFYLWNDVFKDYEIGDAKFSYTYKDGDRKDQTVDLSLLSTKVGEKEIKREFSSFFDDMGNAKQETVVKLMDELKIEGKEVVAVESESAPDSDFQV